MKLRYSTPVVFSADGRITLTQSQLSTLGISDVVGLQEIFDLYGDTLREFGYPTDPDVLIQNHDDYGVSDPNDVEQWLEFFFSLGGGE